MKTYALKSGQKMGTQAGLMDAFASFPPDFMADGREFHEQAERDWTGLTDAVPKDLDAVEDPN